jgi:hypothetical protein
MTKRKPGRRSAASLAAALLGARGGKIGGRIRAQNLSPEERTEIARQGGIASAKARAENPLAAKRRREIARAAAAARWGRKATA